MFFLTLSLPGPNILSHYGFLILSCAANIRDIETTSNGFSTTTVLWGLCKACKNCLLFFWCLWMFLQCPIFFTDSLCSYFFWVLRFASSCICVLYFPIDISRRSVCLAYLLFQPIYHRLRLPLKRITVVFHYSPFYSQFTSSRSF